jgi:uncharacterized phosphatase
LTNTVLGLLRHGQTDWNIDFRLQGTTDIELNQIGIDQAMLAGKLIPGSEWDVLLSSPLSRALETARIVAAAAELPAPVIEPLLLERAFGAAEGLTYAEYRERFPEGMVVPDGETIPELAARAARFLEHIAATYPGQRVLAVSHGAFIRKAIKLASDGKFPLDGERFGNASLSTLIHSTRWNILDYAPHTLGAPKAD